MDHPRDSQSPGPSGLSLLAGEPVVPDPVLEPFAAFDPVAGRALPERFHPATPTQVNDAANAAWRAFHQARALPPGDRATLLEQIARRLSAQRAPIIARAALETGLSTERLESELGRTTSTLELFAGVVRDGSWKQIAIDPPDPRRKPAPRPGLRRMLVPLGPVAVFGASNFPLAYSTAGTDTASALAAGCPVIVKGHPLHPGTGELVARVVAGAVRDAGFPPAWFSFLHAGGARELPIGVELVRHPCVRAAGFTGSFQGGSALARQAATRPDPIPFFAEMGAVNPVFVLPGSVETEPVGIAQHLARSIAAFAGQQCTKPGLIFLIRASPGESFIERLAGEIAALPPEPMLAPRIRRRYLERLAQVVNAPGVRCVLGDPAEIKASADRVRDTRATHEKPVLLRAGADVFLEQTTLHEEIFGPACLIIDCADAQQLLACAGIIQGSLAASVFLGGADLELASVLSETLLMRVGRLVYNGVPTGVEVGWGTVHGGPFPATNRPDTTAVGPFALQRWCRPVCLQNAPGVLLPPELADENPGAVHRIVGGVISREGVPPRRGD
jgi:NADP-dependent aldehyde dehydrogenase